MQGRLAYMDSGHPTLQYSELIPEKFDHPDHHPALAFDYFSRHVLHHIDFITNLGLFRGYYLRYRIVTYIYDLPRNTCLTCTVNRPNNKLIFFDLYHKALVPCGNTTW